MALITSTSVRGVCPVCGAAHATCGGPADATPVDDPIHKETAMTEPNELSEYTWDQNGQEMTGRLTASDAERLGARPAGETAATDGADSSADDDKATGKARKAQNK